MVLDLSVLPPRLHVGTSSFSAPDWCGSFYPADLPPHEFLTHYARTFRTVEIDATWHFMPGAKTVAAWERKVPPGFLFSAKVPKTITHEKQLLDCGDDWKYFLETMEGLGSKLGPLLFQFPAVSKRQDPKEHETGSGFLRRLEAFLPLLPEGRLYVVEIRNPTWIASPLCDLLRSRNIALALVDYVTMPQPERWFDRCDPITSDFSYVRFLGDHHAMDELIADKREKGEKTGDWNELVIDRSAEMRAWIPVLRTLTGRVADVFCYFNNHYAGFAPGSVELLLQIWRETEGQAPAA
ncbi:MAG: DUF72 domain-containing protein [Candidatus Eisenbacteria bacterium]|nr:DUF72 domain-containing protein [Candidatus Eisenbacteria bacterium]